MPRLTTPLALLLLLTLAPSSLAQAPCTPTLQHRTGGTTRCVEALGSRLYLATWNTLNIYDTTNPAAPTLLGQFSDGGLPINDMEIISVPVNGQSRRYLAMARFSRWTLLDVTTPLAVTVLKDRVDNSRSVLGLTLDANNLYLAIASRGVEIVPIAGADTTPIGTYASAEFCTDVARFTQGADTYLCIFDGTAATPIIRITNPAAPTLVSTLSLGSPLRAAAALGSTLHLTADDGALRIVDCSNPASPSLRGQIAVTPGTRAIALSGARAYIGSDAQSFLRVVDVSNPAAPSIIASQLTLADRDIAIGNNAIVYACSGIQGLRTFNFSTPSAPVQLNWYETLIQPNDLVVSADAQGLPRYAYIADLLAGVTVMDVSNPAAAPTVAGALDFGGLTPSNSAEYIALEGNRLCAAGSNTLWSMNVSNPAQPTLLGSAPVAGIPADLCIENARAHVILNPQFGGGLAVYDLPAAAAPSLLGSISIPGSLAVAAEDNVCFIAAGASGLRLFDTATPSSIAPLATLATPGSAVGIALSDGRAFIMESAAGDVPAGLSIADVSNPVTPAILGRVELFFTPTDCSIRGTRAYVVGSNVFATIDIANPAAPILLNWTLSNGGLHAIDTRYRQAFIAEDVRGLTIFHLPHELADFNQSGAVSVQDIFDFLTAYFAADLQADINADTGVSVQDIFDYLSLYFGGC